MISADSALQPEESLEDFPTVMRSGRVGATRKIEQIAIEIKHVIETVGSITAETGFRADAVRWAFARNEHRRKERAEFPLPSNVGLFFVFDQSAGAVGYAKAESRGVVNFPNAEGADPGKHDLGVRHAIGIALNVCAQSPSRIQVILQPATQVQREMCFGALGKAGG